MRRGPSVVTASKSRPLPGNQPRRRGTGHAHPDSVPRRTKCAFGPAIHTRPPSFRHAHLPASISSDGIDSEGSGPWILQRCQAGAAALPGQLRSRVCQSRADASHSRSEEDPSVPRSTAPSCSAISRTQGKHGTSKKSGRPPFPPVVNCAKACKFRPLAFAFPFDCGNDRAQLVEPRHR